MPLPEKVSIMFVLFLTGPAYLRKIMVHILKYGNDIFLFKSRASPIQPQLQICDHSKNQA